MALSFLVLKENGLIKELKFQTGKQINTIHIFPNISRSIDNQKSKFDKIIKCNMKNTFLEKLYAKWSGESSLKKFSKKSKLSISLDQQIKVLYNLLLVFAQVECNQNILKLRCRPLAFTSFKAFSKIKKRFGTTRPASFLQWFLKKIVCFYFLINVAISVLNLFVSQVLTS